MSGPHPAPLLYLVTPGTGRGGRSIPELVTAALRGARAPGRRKRAVAGSRVAVQLREPDLTGAALLSLATELRTITREAGAALFINDRIDVAMAVEADGVHLGWRSLSVEDVRAIAPGLAIALSAHTLADVEAAAAKAVSFAVFGPIFDTPSKRGLVAPVGLETLAQAAKIGFPLLALGGVEPGNARACLDAGAQGLGVIRSVMGANDPGAATASLLACFPRVSSRT